MADTLLSNLLNKPQVLIAEDAIPRNLSPKGVRYTSFPIHGSHLYEIKPEVLKDGKWVIDERYEVPKPLVGSWTSKTKSEQAIYKVLSDLWKVSDNQATKLEERKLGANTSG